MKVFIPKWNNVESDIESIFSYYCYTEDKTQVNETNYLVSVNKLKQVKNKKQVKTKTIKKKKGTK